MIAGTLCLMAFTATAQLSGVYTINSAVATGGTNYQTFTAFATDLNTLGVSGPITVNVVAASGPYVEQIAFNQITGASSVNRITINGNNNLITFASTNFAAPWTIGMNGADYFTFNALNFEATGTSNAFATILYNNANYNMYNSCTFSTNITSTGSGVIPFVISGSGTSNASSAPSANFTSINSCTTSGGYNGISIYGNGAGPNSAASNAFQDGNVVRNCVIRDFYYAGIWSYRYTKNTQLLYNTIECPNRTNTTTKSGIYSYYNQGLLCEGNHIRNLFGPGLQTSTSTSYGIYCAYNLDSYSFGYSLPSRYPNIIRNNIVSDINHNGDIYGVYFYYADGQVVNNTISLDNTGSTGGTTYGIYTYGQTQYLSNCSNNIITITRAGSGTKYGYYSVGGANAGTTGDKNDIYVNAPAGTNYTGYYSALATTQANLASQGFNVNGFSVDPMYTNIALQDYMPTNAAINNTANPMGILFDQRMAVRNGTTPDIGALEFLTPLCTGTPTLSAINGPTFALCPGENAAMALANLVPDAGITYAWAYSNVSNVGPFTNVVPASPIAINYTGVNQTTNGWYQVVATCTNPGGGNSSQVFPITIAAPTSSTVPAYETFEGVGIQGRLPNCSWAATSQGGANVTYVNSQSGNRVPRNGTSFGTFNNGTPGTSAYFTNDIAMNAGITYSAAVWYATEYFGYNNWSNLQILVGPNQSTVGAVVVASVAAAISGPYVKLDGLFTVPSSGNYYVGIRATSSTGNATYLMIDDLSITIPCTPASGNSPTLSASASANTICAGTAIGLNATGADTYTWSVGQQNGPSINDSPMTSGLMNYTVVGTNTLTGCEATAIIPVQVDAAPNVFAVANPPVVCAGSPVIMTAYGANSYAWSNSSIGQVITVNPTTPGTSNYTVIGTNALGCTGTFVQAITVNALPNVVVSSSNPGAACKDDMLTLTANGGVTYQWYSNTNSAILQGNPVNLQAASSTVFTVMATGANGCVGKTTLTQNIEECTGIAKVGALSGVSVYPNPTSGVLTVEFNSNVAKSVSVQDLTGRVIMTANGTDSNITVDLSNLAAGVYYVKLQSEGSVSVVKVVKE